MLADPLGDVLFDPVVFGGPFQDGADGREIDVAHSFNRMGLQQAIAPFLKVLFRQSARVVVTNELA